VSPIGALASKKDQKSKGVGEYEKELDWGGNDVEGNGYEIWNATIESPEYGRAA
jgi:hypothetical protein